MSTTSGRRTGAPASTADGPLDPGAARRLLRRDLREAALTLSPAEARYLVDLYYEWQRFRIAGGNQVAALGRAGEPHRAISWAQAGMLGLEQDVAAVLDRYTLVEPSGMGQWCRAITGIGPILAAGFVAYLDAVPPPTVGHWWRWAGLDPSNRWLGQDKARELVAGVRAVHPERAPGEAALAAVAARVGRPLATIRVLGADRTSGRATWAALESGLARRPWNARLKVLCWKAAESFVKVSGKAADVYGKLYQARKAYEAAKNAAGDYAPQAAAQLREKRYGADTEARKQYEQGRLPPAHLHARAERYCVKRFLADYHGEAYRRHFGSEPPLPYPVAILGHAHHEGGRGLSGDH